MTRLVPPDPDRCAEWIALVADNDDSEPPGSGLWQVPQGATPEGFAAHLSWSTLYADTDRPVPRGVHYDQFWITDDADLLVGFVQVRHALNDRLRVRGGHIGYSVRRSRQGEGHATRALGLALVHARGLGLDRVLITCDDTNAGSIRVIEANGGVLADVTDGVRRSWVPTPPG
ncbi:GNAT family N-acetyltransferase [Nocardioides sp.]|uniref:GNAT family N-acetyltransferase n=1 Tax=Nocardioides sp. TaxID=35761 RepID=UPI002617E9AF|nr:GNAT family N-acetyltransferase [Nocardioides sp.]